MGSRVLYLVRHGQYVTEDNHRRQGLLTALGRRQAHRTGKRLTGIEFDDICHSDLPRAVETAEIIAANLGSISMHSMRALRELTPPFGRIPGQKPRPRKELAEIREVADTLTKRFFTAPRGKKCRTELIVAHGNLIRYLVRLSMGDSAVDWWKMGTFNCGLTRLQIQQEGPNFLIQFNDIGHLPTSMQTTM